MTNKFEKLLDYLVNEEMDKANELFHEIVVEKSRSIYENLIAQEAAEDEDEDEEMDENMHTMDEEESMYEIGGDHSDNFVDSVVDKDAMGDDDMDMDMPGDDMGMDDHEMNMDHGDGEIESVKQDVEDIKDKLDQIFAAITSKDSDIGSDDDMDFDGMGDDDMGDDDMGDDDMGDDDMGDDEDDEDDEDEDNFDETFVREYRELVRGKGKDYTAGSPGENGAHTRSAINANPSDRPHSKANAGNIAQSGKGENPDGTRPKTHDGGLAGKPKGSFVGSGTLNVDGKQTKGYTDKAKAPKKEAGANTKDVLP